MSTSPNDPAITTPVKFGNFQNYSETFSFGGVGGISGFLCGFLMKKLGKILIISTITGLLILKQPENQKYLTVNWQKINIQPLEQIKTSMHFSQIGITSGIFLTSFIVGFKKA